MRKRVLYLLPGVAVMALAFILPGNAEETSSGSNIVEVESCEQVGDDIRISRDGETYGTLTSECRDAGHGMRDYTLSCTADDEYRVEWVEPCGATVDDDSDDEETPVALRGLQVEAKSANSNEHIAANDASLLGGGSYGVGRYRTIDADVDALELEVESIGADEDDLSFAFQVFSNASSKIGFNKSAALRGLADANFQRDGDTDIVVDLDDYRGDWIMILTYARDNDGSSQIDDMSEEVDDIIPLFFYIPEAVGEDVTEADGVWFSNITAKGTIYNTTLQSHNNSVRVRNEYVSSGYPSMSGNIEDLDIEVDVNGDDDNVEYGYAWTTFGHNDGDQFNESMAAAKLSDIVWTNEDEYELDLDDELWGNRLLIMAYVRNGDGVSEVDGMATEVDDITAVRFELADKTFRTSDSFHLRAQARNKATGELVAKNDDSVRKEGEYKGGSYTTIASGVDEITVDLDVIGGDDESFAYMSAVEAKKDANISFDEEEVKIDFLGSFDNGQDEQEIDANSYRGKYVQFMYYVSNQDGVSEIPNMLYEVDDIVPLRLYFSESGERAQDSDDDDVTESDDVEDRDDDTEEDVQQDDDTTENGEQDGDCPLTPGKAYTYNGTSAVWLITNGCTKRPFQSASVFKTYFDDFGVVKTVPAWKLQNVLDDIAGFVPKGPKYDPKGGALVKIIEDDRVYLLLSNQKYWITSEDTFNALNYKWIWIEDVDKELLNNYESAGEITDTSHHPVGSLVKYEDSEKVYRLEEGAFGKVMKRHITNEDVFNALGYRFDRVVEIDSGEEYETGAPITMEELS